MLWSAKSDNLKLHHRLWSPQTPMVSSMVLSLKSLLILWPSLEQTFCEQKMTIVEQSSIEISLRYFHFFHDCNSLLYYEVMTRTHIFKWVGTVFRMLNTEVTSRTCHGNAHIFWHFVNPNAVFVWDVERFDKSFFEHLFLVHAFTSQSLQPKELGVLSIATPMQGKVRICSNAASYKSNLSWHVCNHALGENSQNWWVESWNLTASPVKV